MSPHCLGLYVEAERGGLSPCPSCGKACPAHDFAEKTWRHLNFFQHHCHLHARVPRTQCPEHGIKRIEVPWARPGSDFTLLFEQARHAEYVVRRWISGLTHARLEGMNGLFQTVRSRARGYRNEANFIAMIYRIGSPVGRMIDQVKST